MNKHMEWTIFESASQIMCTFGRAFIAPVMVAGVCSVLTSCCIMSGHLVPANFDNYIGTTLTSHHTNIASFLFQGLRIKVARELGVMEEREIHHPHGCIFVFGINKKTDVIEYWRVDSGTPETCMLKKGFCAR